MCRYEQRLAHLEMVDWMLSSSEGSHLVSRTDRSDSEAAPSTGLKKAFHSALSTVRIQNLISGLSRATVAPRSSSKSTVKSGQSALSAGFAQLDVPDGAGAAGNEDSVTELSVLSPLSHSASQGQPGGVSGDSDRRSHGPNDPPSAPPRLAPRPSLLNVKLASKLTAAAAGARALMRDAALEPPTPARSYLLKGLLWRGMRLTPPAQPLVNPFVKILIDSREERSHRYASTAGSPVGSRGTSMKSAAAFSRGGLSRGESGCYPGAFADDEDSVVEKIHDSFRSKTASRATKWDESAVAFDMAADRSSKDAEHEWNERFALGFPCDLEHTRLVLALYDRRVGAYSRDVLLAYSVVPLSVIQEELDCDDDVDDGADPTDPNARRRAMIFEFALHPSREVKKQRSRLVAQVIPSKGKEDANYVPKLELSLAVHHISKRVQPRGPKQLAQLRRPVPRPLAPSERPTEPLIRSSAASGTAVALDSSQQPLASPRRLGPGLGASSSTEAALDAIDAAPAKPPADASPRRPTKHVTLPATKVEV